MQCRAVYTAAHAVYVQCRLFIHCQLQIHCRLASCGSIFVHCTYTASKWQCTCSLHCSYTGFILPVHSTLVWVKYFTAIDQLHGKKRQRESTDPIIRHCDPIFVPQKVSWAWLLMDEMVQSVHSLWICWHICSGCVQERELRGCDRRCPVPSGHLLCGIIPPN